MTLYLKYRPKTLEELDLTEVRESLKKIVASGNIPHALLFSGPKGLGKTSAARILAKIVNCESLARGEPCNKCKHCKAISKGTHMDVIELDAASHRGIDDVRALREGVALSPAQGNKKVYIIDEAHMLTVEASNALLKTLEEPPNHVMFILATTNPEKLIETIRSRVTNIVFKKPSEEETKRALSRVIKSEKLKLDGVVIQNIVEAAGGSLRDAVKILETQDIVKLQNDIDIDKFLNLLFDGNTQDALGEIQSKTASGVSIEIFTKKILDRARSALLSSQGLEGNPLEGVEPDKIISLIKKITETLSLAAYCPIEELSLEIAVVEWCAEVEQKPKVEVKKNHEKIVSPSEFKEEEKASAAVEFDNDSWSKILACAAPRNKSVEALLKAARPMSFDGNVLTLGVFYSFHKERLESQPHRQILDEIIKEVFGKNIRIVCTLTTPPTASVERVRSSEGVVLTESPPKEPLTTDAPHDIIKLAKEMFGS